MTLCGPLCPCGIAHSKESGMAAGRKVQLNTSRAVYGAVMTVISFEIYSVLVRSLLGFAMQLWHPGASLASPVGVPLAVHYGAVILYTALPLGLAVYTAGRFGRRSRPARREGLPLCRSVALLLPIFMAVTIAASLLFGLLSAGRPQMSVPGHGMGLWVQFLCICIIPAVGEEWLFRGTVQPMLQVCGPWTAIVGQALLFGAAHSFGAPMLTAVISGLALGLIYTLAGDLRVGMILHGINNAIAFWETYCYQYADNTLTTVVIVLLDAVFVVWAVAAALHIKRRRLQSRFYPVDLSTGHGQLLHSPVFWAAFACMVLAQVMNV